MLRDRKVGSAVWDLDAVFRVDMTTGCSPLAASQHEVNVAVPEAWRDASSAASTCGQDVYKLHCEILVESFATDAGE